jgi:HK97 family phage portal protein
MFDFVDDLVKQYEPKQRTVKDIMVSMGATGEGAGATPSNAPSLTALYGNITWVYRCIGFIASNLARLPWKYMRGDEDVTEQLTPNIFDMPNPLQTRYDFLVESISRLQLQGEMFWELLRGSSAVNNQVLALFPDWRSEEVEIIPDQKKYQIKQYKRTINAKTFVFAPEEVFYLKYFNPANPLRGMSPLFPARHTSTSDLNATYYTKQFFKQGARPSGILSTDVKLTTAEQERLEAHVKKRYQSVEQMHEIMILWGGLEFTSLNTMDMTDMQFKDLKEMSREEIVAAFGLSLEVLGLGQKTYENVQFFRRMAWTETMQPLMDKFLGLLNKFIQGEIGTEDIVIEVDYSNVEALREERSKKVVDYDKGLRLGAVTPNEMREDVFGKDPLPDPAMDQTYIVTQVTPTGQEEQTEGANPPVRQEALRLLSKKKWSHDDRTKIWWMKIKQIEPFEPVFESMIREIFDEINADIKKKIPLVLPKKASGTVVGAGAGDPPPGVFFDVDYWKKRLAEEGTPIIAATMKFTADHILTSENLAWDPVHPYVRSLIGQRVENFSTFVAGTESQNINSLVTKTLQETADLGIRGQTRALQEVFDRYNVVAKKNRAALIARTETMGAANAGTQSALVQGGFLRKMWITSRDDRVRDSHQIDGQVVNVDEAFELADGSAVAFPQDFNERCIIIDTLEPKT